MNFLIKNKFLIQNDPQRELLMYPTDDVSEIVLPRRFRTVDNNIPKFSESLPPPSATLSSISSGSSNTNGNGVYKNGEQKNGDHNGHSDLTRKKSDTGSSSSTSSSSSSTLTSAVQTKPSSPSIHSDSGSNSRPRSPMNASCSSTLLTRQALHTYQSDNHLIHYKYSAYGGSCRDLPRYVYFYLLI